MSDVATTPADDTIDLARLDRIIDEFKGNKGAVIPILQRTQDAFVANIDVGDCWCVLRVRLHVGKDADQARLVIADREANARQQQ